MKIKININKCSVRWIESLSKRFDVIVEDGEVYVCIKR